MVKHISKNCIKGENMQVNKTNNVIFLKNVESNIIDEAIVILKENIKMDKFKLDDEKNESKKVNILKEAEMIVNHNLKQQDVNFEKYKVEKLKKKNRNLKIINILLIISALAIVIILHEYIRNM